MGESNTRCRASVSSTAPRLDPRWPPVSATACDDEVADLAASSVSSGYESSRRSSGSRIPSRITDRDATPDRAPEQACGDGRHLRSAVHDASSISPATSASSPAATAASASAMAEGLAECGADDRHLGDQPGQERRRRRAAVAVRRRRARGRVRRRRPGRRRRRDGRDDRRARAGRLVLRQRRRRRARATSFVDMPVDEWRRVLRVNLDGAFYTSQEAVKHWVARWGDGDEYGGSLVFTSSGSAFFGQPRGEHYGGSKAAIIAMSKGIAVEYARYKVRSNAIVPGLDRHRDGLRRPALGQVHRAQHAAHPGPPLGRGQGLRRPSPPTSPARRAATTPAT